MNCRRPSMLLTCMHAHGVSANGDTQCRGSSHRTSRCCRDVVADLNNRSNSPSGRLQQQTESFCARASGGMTTSSVLAHPVNRQLSISSPTGVAKQASQREHDQSCCSRCLCSSLQVATVGGALVNLLLQGNLLSYPSAIRSVMLPRSSS
jgi:hypothetical protein